ncbi:hypothetical protein [Streptomyces corynorhini]|uniref:hypothetical protein n=1 Tax=Streptomyces corynorhini TaxID=2282652 RepID=UPI0018F6DCE5|nr:hypothetical protein [Streptomyces corynorhini]
MDQRSDSGTRTGAGEGRADEVRETGEGRRLELSVPQVAGSALAAVTAAVLASRLGVYGTIIGAGVVSVVATCGGSVFQHLFRRTGEQIRVVTVQARPGGRQVPVRPEPPGPPDASALTRADPGPAGGDPEEFGAATTHGTRVRGRRRPVLAAAVVFLVAMAGISGYELIAGQDLTGDRGTTVGHVVGGGDRSTPSGTPSDSPEPGRGRTPDGAGTDSGASPGTGATTGPGQDSGAGSSAEPSAGPSDTAGTDGSGPSGTDPAPTPSGSAGSATSDTGSGTGSDGPAQGGATGRDSGSGTSGTSGTSSTSGTSDTSGR